MPFSPNKKDLVLVVAYFGWVPEVTFDAIVVVDMAQALLSKPPKADFLVYSPGKFLPMPDGGILVGDITCELKEQDWWLGMYSAMNYRRKHECDNSTWYNMFLEAKKTAPVGYYAMSSYSKGVLDSFPVELIRQKNRENYLKLLELIPGFNLPDEVVPIGFPVKYDKKVQEKLFSKNIFPPAYWGDDPRFMTLPCDYRYSMEDMEKLIRCYPIK